MRTRPHALWVWGLPLLIASSVAWARVQAGEHFPSDMLVGAAVGTAIGLLVPWWHRRSERTAR